MVEQKDEILLTIFVRSGRTSRRNKPRGAGMVSNNQVKAFNLEIPVEAIDDLPERLARTRYAGASVH
jgi:hypothetical protein